MCVPRLWCVSGVFPAWAHMWHFSQFIPLSLCVCVCVCESDTVSVGEFPTVLSFNMIPKTQHHIKALLCSRERPVWVLEGKHWMSDDNEGLSSLTVFLGSYWAKDQRYYQWLYKGAVVTKIINENGSLCLCFFRETAEKILKVIQLVECMHCVTFDRTFITI